MPESAPIKKNGTRRLVISAGVIVIVAFVLAPTAYLLAFNDRVMPGITISGIKIGGLTKEAASAKVNAAVAIYENAGMNFEFNKKGRVVEPVQIPNGNADAAHQLLDIGQDAGMKTAITIGHAGNVFERLTGAAMALAGRYQLFLPYTMDATGFKDALRKEWKSEESPVADSRLIINMNGESLARVTTTADKSGFEFDYDRAISDLRAKIAMLDVSPVELQPARTDPTIYQAYAEISAKLVPAAISLAPLTLSADEKRWTLTASDLAPMLEAYLKTDGTPSVRVKTDTAAAYFQRLAANYDVTPADTRFEIDPTTQKMTVFSPGKNGRRINVERSVALLDQALAKQINSQDGRAGFNLVFETAKSQVFTRSAAELGIKEVIGIGRSDFSGSSANRIKNIKHGSDKLNGVLVAPDAEFSALGVLESVTIEDGYFPEQIILGDKIEPGVGGGLCQIGTTLFRGAMNSGLPITERQNHSLVVHYYSDPTNGNPGTDATLYGPHPDLRFVNNTGHWILLTTDVNTKNKALTYTFWGTSDGRSGSYTPPKVLNWIAAPAEVQNIDDPSLEPGKQKCQNAFSGASTTFAYTIVNPDGSITQRDFASHYRALPKICQNGVAPPPTDGSIPPVDTNANTNINQNLNINN